MTTELLLMIDGQVLHAAVPPGEYIIGSAEDAGLRLDDPSVSSAHARLVVKDNTISIEDLGSERGTFIEEEPTVGAARCCSRPALRACSRWAPKASACPLSKCTARCTLARSWLCSCASDCGYTSPNCCSRWW